MSLFRLGRALAVLATAIHVGTTAEAQEDVPVIERVEVVNNVHLQAETLLFYVETRAGDLYDPEQLRKDFRRLWGTGFLDDLAVEAVDGRRGKIVRFRIVERKRIQIVDYRGSSELDTAEIEEALQGNDAAARIDTFYDPARARKAESIIELMLTAKGRPFGTVRHETRSIGGSGQQLSFIIDDGPRAKIRSIEFEGNDAFSDAELRGELKQLKPVGLFNLSWLGGKTTYTEQKWLGDPEDPQGERGRLEDFYLRHGYVTVRIGSPRIEYTDGETGTLRKSPVKWMKVVIPVEEGERYRLGELSFEGLTVLDEEYVRRAIDLRSGDVYDDSRFKEAYEGLRDLYGGLGYFQWTASTQRTPDPESRVVDVVVKMEEDVQYFVGEITFVGNDTTRDKVIRREVFLNEASVFNTHALKLSVQRINQLGYFKPMESAPDIQPNPYEENKVDITFQVEEQNRNQFTFGGGVSGLEGTFVNASFSTTNFLGKGETFTLAAQTGRRTRNFQFAITEPYFLDRPIAAGVDVFFRRITYLSYGTFVGYGQQDQGISLSTGTSVGHFSRVRTSYSYRIIDLYDVDDEAIDTLAASAPAETPGAPIVDPTYLGELGRRYESGVVGSYVRNTVDHPFHARRGNRYTASFQFVGGILGGSENYLRPSLELIHYRPVGGRMALGLRGQGGYIQPFGVTEDIPYYQRYFLGGENQLRGYAPRTVAPVDPETGTSVGGNKFLLFNAEYYVDVGGPARFILFFDAGQAYAEGQKAYWKTMSTCTGMELRVLMPILNVPFRLIYSWNLNRDYWQPARAFKLAVGTTF